MPPSGLRADGPIPGHCWCRTAAAPGNAFPGAEPGSGRQTLDTRAPLRSREGPGSRVQRASAHGLSPEADERVAGVRHGCGRSCSSHPCLRGIGAGGWGRRSCRVARRDCALLSCLKPGIPGPPTFRLGRPRVTRCQALCSRVDGPWAGPPTPARSCMKVTGGWKFIARKHVVSFVFLVFFSKICIDFGKVVGASG